MNTREETAKAADLINQSIERVAQEQGTGNFKEIIDPESAVTALFLRATGANISEVREATGLHFVTVKALEGRHGDVLKLIKKQTAATTATIAGKAAELTARKLKQLDENPEELKKVSVKDLSLSTAILIDKARLLQGDSTAVVEHRKTISFEDYQASVREAQAKHAIDVEERDITPAEEENE